MKRKLALAVAPALFSLAFALPEKNEFKVSGKIDGITTGKIYLESSESGAPYLDSTEIKNGTFSFKGNISRAMFYVLRLQHDRGRLGFFLQPGNIVINGHKDSLFKATVKGSPLTAQYREWGAAWSAITQQAGVLYRRLDSASQGGKTEAPAEIRRQVDAGFEDLSAQTDRAVTSFIQKYPESPVGPFIIIDRYINYPNPEMVDKTVALLGKGAKSSYYGKKIEEHLRIAKKTGIGATPSFSLPDTSGNLFELASYRGKYVLVDFWASWCGPCRKENPNVVKAYTKYHDKGFEIVGVSLDNKKEPWLKAIHADGLTWQHVSDLKGWQSAPVVDYGIKSVPTSFLLDKEGKVIAKDLRGEALEKKLEEIFEK